MSAADAATTRLFATERRVAAVEFGPSSSAEARGWAPDASRIGRRDANGPRAASEHSPGAGSEQAGSEHGSVAQVPFAELEAERRAWSAREAELLEAVEVARADGAEAGRAERQAEVDSMRAQLGDALATLGAHADRLTSAYRTEAAALAFELARAVVGEAVLGAARPGEPGAGEGRSSAALEHLAAAAIDRLPRTREALLRCHPEDLTAIEAFLPQVAARRGDPIAIRAVGVPGIERGAVLIDFDEGSVDARPSVALAVLRQAVDSAMRGADCDAETSAPDHSAPDARAQRDPQPQDTQPAGTQAANTVHGDPH